jgi:hypothetical protein
VRRREGGREGVIVPRVWESTVATEGMFGNLNPLGDGPGRSLADHGARVPEVLPAAELEVPGVLQLQMGQMQQHLVPRQRQK